MNIGTLAVVGSILAGLLSVPAVSASITGDVTAAGARLSGTSPQEFQDTPRIVSETVTAESMRKQVETAFGTVTFNTTSDMFSSRLQTPRHVLQVERGPGVEEIAFTSDTVELDIRRTPHRIDEVCTTPKGTLEIVRESGGTTTTFSGTSRRTVKARCNASRAIMEEQLAKVHSLSVDLGLTLPDVEIVDVNASEESVTIRNAGGTTVNMTGWTLSDDGDSTFSGFAGVVLSPGSTVTVYSDEAGDPLVCEESDGPDHEVCWDSSFVWNDDGETATLANDRGAPVDTHTYQ